MIWPGRDRPGPPVKYRWIWLYIMPLNVFIQFQELKKKCFQHFAKENYMLVLNSITILNLDGTMAQLLCFSHCNIVTNVVQS